MSISICWINSHNGIQVNRQTQTCPERLITSYESAHIRKFVTGNRNTLVNCLASPLYHATWLLRRQNIMKVLNVTCGHRPCVNKLMKTISMWAEPLLRLCQYLSRSRNSQFLWAKSKKHTVRFYIQYRPTKMGLAEWVRRKKEVQSPDGDSDTGEFVLDHLVDFPSSYNSTSWRPHGISRPVYG